jgi:hypothetical protein
MRHQVSRISVHQTAKVLAIIYGSLGLIFSPLIWLASRADPQQGMPLWLVVLFPLLYAVFGYIATAIGAAVYNAVAARIGGVEVTLTQPGSDVG